MKRTDFYRSQIKTNCAYEGESIEEKMRRVTTTNEPIEDGAPQIFTERDAGVEPQYDIRTDRWEIAQEAMDKVSRSKIAQREDKPKQDKPSEKEVETPVTE